MEEQERILYGTQPIMAGIETFTFDSIKRNETNIEAVLQSLDPLDAKVQGKMDEVRERLKNRMRSS